MQERSFGNFRIFQYALIAAGNLFKSIANCAVAFATFAIVCRIERYMLLGIKDLQEFSDDRLTPEFLIGYDLQMKWLKEHKLVKGKWQLKEVVDESGEITPEDLEETNINES